MPGTRPCGTAQFGAPVRNGSTSIPALAARSTIASMPRPVERRRRALGCTPPHSTGCGCFRRRRASSRWNCSPLGIACGTTPQNLAGSAWRSRRRPPGPASATAKTAVQARTRLPIRILAFDIGLSSPSARPGRRASPRWRRCRITTAPIEIAARTAIAIRIGTSGEESRRRRPVRGWLVLLRPAADPPGCALEPLPGLPWPAPPSSPGTWPLPPPLPVPCRHRARLRTSPSRAGFGARARWPPPVVRGAWRRVRRSNSEFLS